MEKKNGLNLLYACMLLLGVFTRLEAQSPIFNRQYQLFAPGANNIYGAEGRAIGMDFDATNRHLYLAYELITDFTFSGSADPHIVKIDLATNTLVYDQSIGSYQTGYGSPLTGISVSKAGNVFQWGDFDSYGSLYAAPLGGMMDDNNAGDFYVLYNDTAAIMKCNTSNTNTAIWKVNFTNAKPTALDIDTDGTVYVFGQLTGGTLTLNGLSVSTTGGGSFFMAKFRPNGTCVSLVQNTVGLAKVVSTRILANHEILLAGTHDTGTSMGATALSGNGFFTARMDTLGSILSASHIGANFAPASVKYSIEMDSLQQVYTLKDNALNKYSSTGALIWTKANPLADPSPIPNTYMNNNSMLAVSNGGNFGFGFNFFNPNFWQNTSSDLIIDGQSIYHLTDGSTGINNDGHDLAWASASYNAPTAYPVVASFVATEFQCGGGMYSFDNHSGGATSYSWNFGDPASGANNTSTQSNLSHTFSQYGQSYTVSLTATGPGGTNTTTQTVFVHAPWGLVTINPTPAVACAGDSVAVTITMLDNQWCGNYNNPNFYTGYGYGCSNYVFFDLHEQNYVNMYSTLDSVTATGNGTHATYLLPPGNYTVATQNQILFEEFEGCGFYENHFTIGGPKVSYNSCVLSANVSTSIQWFLNGVAIAGATSQTYVPTATGNYSFSSSLACMSDTINVSTLPISCITSPNFTSAVINCSDVSFVNTSTGNGNMLYSWDFGDGSPIYYGANPPIHTYLSGGLYTVQLTVINSTNCSSCMNTYSSIISTGAVTLSTSTPTICTGGTAQLSVTNIPGSTYSWQYFNTTGNIWLDLTGITGTSYSQALTASRMYRVNYVTPCGSGTTPAVTVNVIPDPVVTVSSSNVNLCSGTNTTLTATLTGGTGTPIYQWQEQISSVYTNIAGATNQTYTTPNLTASKNYKVVSSMSGSGCNASGTGLISLVVKALPTVVTTPASPSYCVGGTVSIAASGASTYSWSPATGLSAATGTPVIASGTSSTTYTLTGTGTNGCSKTISVPVTVNPDPSISISGNNSVCSGATTTFTATNAGGSGTCSLVWQSSTNGTTWTTISGATGTTYTTPALSANAYYRATYACTGGGCSPAAVSNSIYVTLISPTPMVLSTSTPTICTGGTAQLSLNAGTSGTTYTWQYLNTSTNVWTNISGYVGTTNTTYSAVLTASASYRVLYVTSCGTGTTATLMVNVIPDPAVTVASSSNNFCAGGNTTLTATITGGTGTPSYQWQEFVANVYNNVAGATNATYTTTSITANKYYKVLATMSGSGCGVTGTGVILVSVLPLPTVAVSPTSPSYCVGGSVSLAASGTTGNTYSWSPATNLSASTGTPVIASGTSSTTYSLTGIGTNGCSKTISVPVTVNSDPSISITGSNVACQGASLVFTAIPSGGAGTCTIVWQQSTNGTTWTTIAGATGNSYTTPALNVNTYFRCTYSCNGGGCSPAGVSNSIFVTISPATSITLSATNTSICQGNSAQLTVGGGTISTTYTWQESNNNGSTWSNITGYVGTTLTSYTGSALIANMQYRVIANIPNCGIYTTSPIAISILPLPTLSVSPSNASICVGGNATFTASGANTYSWIPSTGLSAATGTSVTAAPSTSTTYTMTGVDANGCVSSLSVPLILNAVPTISITGNNAICSGTSTTFTATTTGSIGTCTLVWESSSNATSWTTIAGATGNSYTTSSLSANTYYRSTYYCTASGCNAVSNSILVTVTPTVLATLSAANTTICSGNTVQLSVSGGNASTTYTWQQSTNNGITWTTISGATSTTYTTPILNTSTQYQVVYNNGACGSDTTNNVVITVNNPLGTITLTQSYSSFCGGQSPTLVSTISGGTGTCNYVWQNSSNGTVWANISGATVANYTTPLLSSDTYYRCIYACLGNNGCDFISNTILVPGNPYLITALPQNICVGGNTQITISGGTSSTVYTWEQGSSTGSSWTSLASTGNAINTGVLNQSAYFRVTFNTNGSCGIISRQIYINIFPVPTATIGISDNNFCGGGTTVLTATYSTAYGTSSLIGTPTYQWQQYSGGVYTDIVGATSQSYTTPALYTSTIYRITPTQSPSGCIGNPVNAQVTVKPLPNVVTSPASSSYCIGGSVSLAASGTTGNTYSWSPATNLSATTGTPVIASPQATTSYTLTGIGTNGCTKTITIPVTVTADPSISISGPTSVPTGTTANLSASVTGGSGTCTRQWQSSTNGTTWTNISGATGASYTTPAITGTKYYRASYNCTALGCSPIAYSNTLAIIGVQPPARMEMPNNELSLSLFPNPADVKIIVHLDMTKDANTVFAINNLVGEEVIKWQGQSENGSYEQEIFLENLASGVYFLTAKIEGRTMIQKFVKE